MYKKRASVRADYQKKSAILNETKTEETKPKPNENSREIAVETAPNIPNNNNDNNNTNPDTIKEAGKHNLPIRVPIRRKSIAEPARNTAFQSNGDDANCIRVQITTANLLEQKSVENADNNFRGNNIASVVKDNDREPQKDGDKIQCYQIKQNCQYCANRKLAQEKKSDFSITSIMESKSDDSANQTNYNLRRNGKDYARANAYNLRSVNGPNKKPVDNNQLQGETDVSKRKNELPLRYTKKIKSKEPPIQPKIIPGLYPNGVQVDFLKVSISNQVINDSMFETPKSTTSTSTTYTCVPIGTQATNTIQYTTRPYKKPIYRRTETYRLPTANYYNGLNHHPRSPFSQTTTYLPAVYEQQLVNNGNFAKSGEIEKNEQQPSQTETAKPQNYKLPINNNEHNGKSIRKLPDDKVKDVICIKYVLDGKKVIKHIPTVEQERTQRPAAYVLSMGETKTSAATTKQTNSNVDSPVITNKFNNNNNVQRQQKVGEKPKSEPVATTSKEKIDVIDLTMDQSDEEIKKEIEQRNDYLWSFKKALQCADEKRLQRVFDDLIENANRIICSCPNEGNRNDLCCTKRQDYLKENFAFFMRKYMKMDEIDKDAKAIGSKDKNVQTEEPKSLNSEQRKAEIDNLLSANKELEIIVIDKDNGRNKGNTERVVPKQPIYRNGNDRSMSRQEISVVKNIRIENFFKYYKNLIGDSDTTAREAKILRDILVKSNVKDLLSPEEYVNEVHLLVTGNCPRRFCDFYVFVTRMQIGSYQSPIGFLLFLELQGAGQLIKYQQVFKIYCEKQKIDPQSCF